MIRKKPRYRNSAHCGGWARNGFHFNAFFKTFFYQRVPRIRYTGSTRPGYKSALFSFHYLRDNALRLSRLIITVYGNNWFSDFEMVQQFQCAQIVSATIKSTSRKISTALKVISFKFPIGVATTYRIPFKSIV